MSIKQQFQSRQRAQFQAVGEFIYIAHCPSELLIQTERGEYRLKQGAQILDDKLSGLVTVENLGDVGLVEVIVGMGRYLPPTDGQKVTVEAMPSIELARGQSLSVDAMPAMRIARGQSVDINRLPEIEIASGQRLEVSKMPAMSLASNQAVKVSSLPVMKMAANQTIGLSSPVEIASGQSLEVSASQTLPVQSVTASGINTGGGELPQTIAQNPTRQSVTIKAAKANTQAVMMGAYPLEAGETITLNTNANIELTGAAGDHIQFIEVMQ